MAGENGMFGMLARTAAESEGFICRDDFSLKVKKMSYLTIHMNEARKKLEQLQGHISSGSWSGESQKETEAYTQLLVTYMNKLCGQENYTPCETMEQAMKDFQQEVDTFEQESVASQRLKTIGERL